MWLESLAWFGCQLKGDTPCEVHYGASAALEDCFADPAAVQRSGQVLKARALVRDSIHAQALESLTPVSCTAMSLTVYSHTSCSAASLL